MTTTHEFNAQCETEKHGGWKASVAEVDCEARAKRLDRLREEIAKCISAETGIDEREIVVRLEGAFPDALDRFRTAHEKMSAAIALREEASAEIRGVVSDLRDQQLTMRDISALLGITPQRVAQLVQSGKSHSAKSTK